MAVLEAQRPRARAPLLFTWVPLPAGVQLMPTRWDWDSASLSQNTWSREAIPAAPVGPRRALPLGRASLPLPAAPQCLALCPPGRPLLESLGKYSLLVKLCFLYSSLTHCSWLCPLDARRHLHSSRLAAADVGGGLLTGVGLWLMQGEGRAAWRCQLQGMGAKQGSGGGVSMDGPHAGREPPHPSPHTQEERSPWRGGRMSGSREDKGSASV